MDQAEQFQDGIGCPGVARLVGVRSPESYRRSGHTVPHLEAPEVLNPVWPYPSVFESCEAILPELPLQVFVPH